MDGFFERGERKSLPEEQAEIPKPGFFDILPAAFRTENSIGSLIAAQERNVPFNGSENLKKYEDFDPFEGLEGTEYADRAQYFAQARDEDDVAKIKRGIDRERADREYKASASGLTGFLADMAAGLTSPEMLIPVGGQAIRGVRTGQSIIRNAGQTAAAGALGAALTETLLQPTQTERTLQESVLNIAGGAVFGGVIGGGVGAAVSRKAVRFRDVAEFEATGARVQIVDGDSSAGAQQVKLDPKMETPMGSMGVGKAMSKLGPLSRILYNSGSANAMKAVTELAETPYLISKNEHGIATVEGGSIETVGKRVMGDVTVIEDVIDELFTQYRIGQSASGVNSLKIAASDVVNQTDKLTRSDFAEQLSVALEDGTHDVPEVKAAAQSVRKIMDYIGKQAEDAGIIPKGLVGKRQKNGKFYRPIIYQIEAITSNRSGPAGDGFEDIVARHFQKDADRAEQDLNRNLEVREELAQKRKTALTQAYAERDELHKKRESFEDTVLSRQTINDIKRYSTKKRPKYPIISILRQRGGVQIGSTLQRELNGLGVTSRAHPGLFRKKSGLSDIDNIVQSEEELFNDLPVTDDGFIDPAVIYEEIANELSGNPLRAANEENALIDHFTELREKWEAKGIDFSKKVDEIRNDQISLPQDVEAPAAAPDGPTGSNQAILLEEDGFTSSGFGEQEFDVENVIGGDVDISRGPDPELEADFQQSLERGVAEFSAADAQRLELLNKQIRVLERPGSLKNAQRLDDLAETEQELLTPLFGSDEARRIVEIDEKIELLERLVEARDPGAARALARETVDKIVGTSEADLGRPVDPGVRGMLQERLLNIDPAEIRGFTQNNMINVLRRYARVVSTDVAMVKKFGDVQMTKQMRSIRDDFAKQRNALNKAAFIRAVQTSAKDEGLLAAYLRTPDGRRQFQAIKNGTLDIGDMPPQEILDLLKIDKKHQSALRKIDKAEKATMRDIRAIRDRLRGQFDVPDDPTAWMHKVERGMLAWNYMRLLGGMTVSAFPDMAMGIFRNGMKRNLKVHMRLAGSAASYKASMKEMRAMGVGTELALDSRLQAMTEYSLGETKGSKFSKVADGAVKNFGKVTLMTPWNAAQKQINGVVFTNFVVETSRKIVKGTATKKEIREMASWNVDAKLAKRIVDQINKHSRDYDTSMLTKFSKWDDIEAANAFRNSVITQVDKTIITPGQEKPLWMSKSGWRLAGQFKSFAMAATQMITVSGMQRRGSEQLSGVMALIALGTLTYATKEKLAGRELPPVDLEHSGDWMKNGIDRSGVTGILFDMNNMLERASGQTVGISPMLSAAGIAENKVATRYANQNNFGTFAGPSVGLVEDVTRVGKEAIKETLGQDGFTEGGIGKARRLVPFQNALGIKVLFDELEEGLERAFGEHPDQKKAEVK